MKNLSRQKLRKLIKLEMRTLMDEDALFVMKDIPGDDDNYQDYSLDHLDNMDMSHSSDCGCHECSHDDADEENLNYMTLPQLNLIAQHSQEIIGLLRTGANLEDWQESHIAQIADDIIEVLHSIEYNPHHN